MSIKTWVSFLVGCITAKIQIIGIIMYIDKKFSDYIEKSHQLSEKSSPFYLYAKLVGRLLYKRG